MGKENVWNVTLKSGCMYDMCDPVRMSQSERGVIFPLKPRIY